METSSDAPLTETSESTPATTIENITLGNLGVTNIIVCCVYGLVMIFICGGNLVVILAIKRTPALHTNTNIFVVNLAVADFSIGLQLLQRMMQELKPEWFDNFAMCSIRYFITEVMTSCSGLTLVGE